MVRAVSKYLYDGAMPDSSPDRELRLLSACCSQVSEGERLSRIQDLAESISWPRVATLAEQHGVVPQVYEGISSAGSIPPDPLRTLYEASIKRSLWFATELLHAIKCLQERGVQTLAYKGAVLAEILYGNISGRQYNDLDFMIHGSDVEKAKSALLDLGYRVNLQLTPRQERAYLLSGYEYAFDHPVGKNLLELHWQVQPYFYAADFDFAAFFDGAVFINVSGQPVRTLCVNDLMLVLCVHSAKHAWMRLSLLCDIAKLSQSPELNWNAVHEQSARLGLQRIVAVSFLLANRWLQCPMPESVRSDDAAKTITAEISNTLATGTEYVIDSPAYFRTMLRLRERRRDRARFLWRLLSTPSLGEWEAIQLPDALFPLYSVVRAGRLAKRLVRGDTLD